MKKFYITLLLISTLVGNAFAQEYNIKFEEPRKWDNIVKKAKKANKLIFVDCYTDWCGPCKMIAKDIFTLKGVADFYNTNFINAKFEMEKDEDGIKLGKVWNIFGYPTLYFIEPHTQEILGSLNGGYDQDSFINSGKSAIEIGKIYSKFINGESSPQFISESLEKLKGLRNNGIDRKIVSGYLSDKNIEQLATSENWNLVRNYISDPNSEIVKMVYSNRDKFYKLDPNGEEGVEEWLAALLISGTQKFVPSMFNKKVEQVEYDNYLQLLANFKSNRGYQKALSWMEIAKNGDAKHYDALFNQLIKYSNDNTFTPKEFRQVESTIISLLSEADDVKILNKGIEYLQNKGVKMESEVNSIINSLLSNHYSLGRFLKNAGAAQPEVDKNNQKIESYRELMKKISQK